MHKISRDKFIYLTFLAASAVLFFFYSTVLLAPNDFLFDDGGDGIKNYYTYLYHAKYGENFTEFTGMNYPYFEHIVYTDAHPFLSWTIHLLGLENYGIGIMNILMLLSYPIGAIFLFKLLRHFGVSNWWSLGAAVTIIFLSPQVYRMLGHYSMAYVFAVPIMWWLLVKCQTIKKFNYWNFIIAGYILIFFFTHPYLGMILTSFGFAYWIVRAIINRNEIKSSLLKILAQAILPIVLFQGLVFLTDTHENRLSNPAGFFDYYASWKSLLVAHDGPLAHLAIRMKINIGNWESWSYIGFSTIIFLIVIGVYQFKNRKEFNLKAVIANEIIIYLIAAYLILMFAFCFPLKFDWMRWVTDLFGPLKQFRVLGRFTWIFYYVITISAVVGLYRLSLKHKRINLLFILGLIFTTLEFAPVHSMLSRDIIRGKNAFKTEYVAPELKEVIDYVEAAKFDAIIFLPFQHMSSENIMLLGDEEANKDAFLLSYHTGIPLLNSVSSRMSLTESIDFNNYFSPGFMEKMLTYDLPKDAKIGIVKRNGVLDPQEMKMIWEMTDLYENDQYLIVDFDQNHWNSPRRFNEIVEKNKNATIQLKEEWRSDTSDVWFYTANYDTCSPPPSEYPSFYGQSSYYGKKNGWNSILTLNSHQIQPGNYVVRFWYDLLVDRPDVSAVVQETQNDTTVWLNNFLVSQSTVIVDKWCMVELEFEVSDKMQTLDILLTGNGNMQPFHIDELMIKESPGPAIFKTVRRDKREFIVYDNYWIDANSFKSQESRAK
ncbi:hypothetical protein [Crocinitomix algicola]|uniref:hypothetical protein n=1 Tax=Crocinitomix algicola TaxID=1740263 RepID=UPI0008732904|nr:hypothetical protein [Crocinitomix algicola]